MGDERTFDEDLRRIREKKMREMEHKIEMRTQGVVHEISDMSFSAFIRDNPRVLVDFWAEWCGPCRMVAPVVEELAMELAGEVAVAKCNTDENPVVSRNYQVSAIPTLLLFGGGRLADRIVGAVPKETIRARVMRAFF